MSDLAVQRAKFNAALSALVTSDDSGVLCDPLSDDPPCPDCQAMYDHVFRAATEPAPEVQP